MRIREREGKGERKQAVWRTRSFEGRRKEEAGRKTQRGKNTRKEK